MDEILYAIVIPVGIYAAGRRLNTRGNRFLLAAASILFGASIFIPSPWIHGQDTQFLTHLFGGGVFTGLIWLYFRPMIGAKPWHRELLVLYVLACSLGVANELFELFAHEIHIKHESLNDTSWDLAANTIGVLIFYGGYRGIRVVKSLFFSR